MTYKKKLIELPCRWHDQRTRSEAEVDGGGASSQNLHRWWARRPQGCACCLVGVLG